MDPNAIRNAVIACIETQDSPVMEARAEALREVAVLLEDLVREHLDDEQLAASLDGLDARRVVFDTGEMTLNVSGALDTLGMRGGQRTADPMLPVNALFSVEPGAVSIVRVAGRESLFDAPQSERQFQRAFEAAVWHRKVELRLS
jgi:hypothetical protein